MEGCSSLLVQPSRLRRCRLLAFKLNTLHGGQGRGRGRGALQGSAQGVEPHYTPIPRHKAIVEHGTAAQWRRSCSVNLGAAGANKLLCACCGISIGITVPILSGASVFKQGGPCGTFTHGQRYIL